MTNDDFAGLFGDDFGKDAAAEFAKLDAAQKAPVTKDGVHYAGDTVDANAHSISWYRLQIAGKALLWVSVDNDRPLPANLPGLPEGATVHGIWVWNADKSQSTATKGLAVRHEHQDGTGVHVDGATVQTFLIPRIGKYAAEFYGV